MCTGLARYEPLASSAWRGLAARQQTAQCRVAATRHSQNSNGGMGQAAHTTSRSDSRLALFAGNVGDASRHSTAPLCDPSYLNANSGPSRSSRRCSHCA